MGIKVKEILLLFVLMKSIISLSRAFRLSKSLKSKIVYNHEFSSHLYSSTNEITSDVKLTEYHSIISDNSLSFGEYSPIIASTTEINNKRIFTDIKTLGISAESDIKENELVWIRGRVNTVRAKGNTCFLVIRSQSFYTIQVCHFKDKENPEISKQLIKFVGNQITLESIVDILGKYSFYLQLY